MVVEEFGGFEPQVGEIRALRTFRIGPGGLLYPLFRTVAWTAGTNTAQCLCYPDFEPGDSHAVPEPECFCGFYAYGAVSAVDGYLHSAHVLAVVACWGRVIAGTRGVRAEHCSVEALWTSSAVPPDLVDAISHAYPDVAMYTDRDRLLAEHPATVLDCYEPWPVFDKLSPRRTLLWRAGVLGTLGAGTLAAVGSLGPSTHGPLWLLTGCLLAFAVVVGRLRVPDQPAMNRILVLVVTIAWVAAGLTGFFGIWLIRVPIGVVALTELVKGVQIRRAIARFPADVTHGWAY